MKLLVFLTGALALVGCALGCTPRVKVIANPTARDQGIRYYRPKPYLLITSGGGEVSKQDKNALPIAIPDARYVSIQLQYLPDFAEEYAIDVRTGFGTADVAIKLENGWNLVSINQNLDSQTDENITAAAKLIESIGKIGPLNFLESGSTTPKVEVLASNIPLGYYESVIGKDSCGTKRLYGFRYVGFMPYQICPTDVSGLDCTDCQTTELYGIVFEKGVMVFRRLDELRVGSSATNFTDGHG